MSESSISGIPKPRRGAPLGNQNARKHGMYASKSEVLSGEDTDETSDITNDIEDLRKLAHDTLSAFRKKEHPTIEQYLSVLRGVSQAFGTLKNLYMTRMVLDKNPEFDPLSEALDNVPPFLDDRTD